MRIRAGIGALKLRRYMMWKRIKPEIFARFDNILHSDMELSEIDYLIDQIEFDIGCYEAQPEIYSRMKRVLGRCEANPLACTVLELSFLQYLDADFDELMTVLFAEHKKGVCLSEAFRIAYPGEEYIDRLQEVIRAGEIMETLLCRDYECMELLFVYYRTDTSFAAYLCGEEIIPGPLKVCMKMASKVHVPEPNILNGDIVTQITAFCDGKNKESDSFPVILIRGAALTGKKFIVRHCARHYSADLLLVDYHLFTEGSDGDFTIKKDALIREAFLYDALVCIYDVSKKGDICYERLMRLLAQWPFLGRPFFMTSIENVNIICAIRQPVLDIEMRKCSFTDNLKLWEALTAIYCPNQPFNAAELADKLPLPVGMIKKAVKMIAASPELYGDVSEIFKLCYRFTEMEPTPSLKRVSTGYTMNNIKLDKKSKKILMSICDQITNRKQVFDVWQMRKLYPYGRCVSVLFTGPPGTGKTMAASVIANTVRLELYRVDLSQITDKYVGETEKRLENIFTQAEHSNCILFFDEADAVFGKRNEVSDSKDRFANAQVAYLLQRIEEYDGVVILASNYRENIDAAFTRRFSHILDFTNPAKDIRREIWQSLFIDGMAYENIDFDYLAEKFELSGAMIKNIVLKAAFFAVANQCPITMQYILQALIQEYKKVGRILHIEDLGEYAYLDFE